MTIQNPPDDEEIRLIIEAKVGGPARIHLFDPFPTAPIGVVLETATRLLNTEFLTYWTKGGPPRIFGLDGFSKPIAVFSERIVEVWADFRAVFTHQRLQPELKMEKIEQITLRTMAEMALTAVDDPSLPAQLAIAAAERCPGLLFVPNEIAVLEYEARGLAYMNCWFFGFAHELGHFHPKRVTERWQDFAWHQLIASINSQEVVHQDYRDEIVASIAAGRTGPLLDLGQLLTEATADACAMMIIFESAIPIMGAADRLDEFSLESFYHEAIFSINVVATFAQIEQMIQARRHGVANRQLGLEISFYKSVIGARATVSFAMFRLYLENRFPGVEIFGQDRQSEILEKTARRFEADVVAWDRGVGAAMKVLFDIKLPCDVGRFLDELNAMGSDLFELDCLARSARAAGKSSWHFEAIDRKLAEPSAILRVEDMPIDKSGSIFFIATLDRGDQSSVPLCLQVGDRIASFVFLNQEIFVDFLTIVRQMIDVHTKVTSTVLMARDEDAVEDQISLWMISHLRPDVLIEGSEGFDKLYTRFLDQTEELGKIGVYLP